jgi:hypothetical protein
MRNFHYLLFALLVIVWAYGFFSFKAPYPIHLLLISALALILVKLLQESKAESR